MLRSVLFALLFRTRSGLLQGNNPDSAVYREKKLRGEGFPGGSAVKNLPVQETQVRSLCREGILEKEMATLSSILDWRIPWTEGAWWATVHGVAKNQMTGGLSTYNHSCYFALQVGEVFIA